MIQFTLPIAPVAKARPRFTRQGHCYTPGSTKSFERRIAVMAKKEGGYKLRGPLRLRVGFVLKVPKRPKFNLPAVRPDLDNYIKALTDGLNGVLYADDAQICEVWAVKIYDLTGAGPRIEVKLEEMT